MGATNAGCCGADADAGTVKMKLIESLAASQAGKLPVILQWSEPALLAQCSPPLVPDDEPNFSGSQPRSLSPSGPRGSIVADVMSFPIKKPRSLLKAATPIAPATPIALTPAQSPVVSPRKLGPTALVATPVATPPGGATPAASPQASPRSKFSGLELDLGKFSKGERCTSVSPDPLSDAAQKKLKQQAPCRDIDSRQANEFRAGALHYPEPEPERGETFLSEAELQPEPERGETLQSEAEFQWPSPGRPCATEVVTSATTSSSVAIVRSHVSCKVRAVDTVGDDPLDYDIVDDDTEDDDTRRPDTVAVLESKEPMGGYLAEAELQRLSPIRNQWLSPKLLDTVGDDTVVAADCKELMREDFWQKEDSSLDTDYGECGSLNDESSSSYNSVAEDLPQEPRFEMRQAETLPEGDRAGRAAQHAKTLPEVETLPEIGRADEMQLQRLSNSALAVLDADFFEAGDLVFSTTTNATFIAAAFGCIVGSFVGCLAGFLGGASVGVILALFTFGLSIPICVAIGLWAGVIAGGTLGGIVGGAIGYGGFTCRRGIRKKVRILENIVMSIAQACIGP